MMNRPRLIFLAMVVLLGVLSSLLIKYQGSANDEGITILCAASLQKPLSQIARDYELSHGVTIYLNFAGSGVLEAQLATAGADLYLPADETYTQRAQSEDLVGDTEALVILKACIIVPKGNPKNIRSTRDLGQSGISLSMADTSSAIGRFVDETLRLSDDLKMIKSQTRVTKPTVNHVIEDVLLGTVDATIAWDSVAQQYEGVELVRVPIFQGLPRTVKVGIVKSRESEAVVKFMRYLAYDSRARSVFEKMGFELVSHE